MLDPLQEITAFASRHGLEAEGHRELSELFARMVGASLLSVSTVADPLVGESIEGSAAEPLIELTGRYLDLGLIGVGGMGEVRRVQDRELHRTIAMKIIRPELLGRSSLVSRFLEEAKVGAQLQHPGVPPVHELGELADGRLYFTMKEIRGRPFSELILEVHSAEGGMTEVGLRRLCDLFAKVCDAVGYAHSRGVVHRDLKPDNVMIGDFGEVLVIDWGLAKVLGQVDDAHAHEDGRVGAIHSARDSDALKTRMGQVFGTAAYMPPEQARGDLGSLNARADVYALGAMLYELLAGRRPYGGRTAQEVLRQVLAAPPAPPAPVAEGVVLPPALLALCAWAMAREPADRPAEASLLAREVREWQDGAKRREAALAVVAQAELHSGATAEGKRQRAGALRAEAVSLHAEVEPWAPEELKAAAWAREDEATALERAASLSATLGDELLRAALTHDPSLPEANAALTDRRMEEHAAAEALGDAEAVERAELRIRVHLEALPQRHPKRLAAAAYLSGDGALSLCTRPEGAEVDLFRYENRNRRLVPVPMRSPGRTPLREVSLRMGSYLCVLRHPGCVDVRYPVHIGRGEHWDGVPPGRREPQPVDLPAIGECSPDEVVVPAGWFWSGGDPAASDSLPRRRLWCDGLLMQRFPVTNRSYLAFLDDLVAQGLDAEARQAAPRERAGGAGEEGAAIYGIDSSGHHFLRPDGDGDVWLPDWPVFQVSWHGAVAHAQWRAARERKPWRLPGSLEWEKAARGVDGRFFPWGDFHDPSWVRMRDSLPGRPLPTVVDSYPVDSSVYGVRGVAGNILTWCAERLGMDAPPAGELRVRPPLIEADISPTARRVHRGGHWDGIARFARCAARYGSEPATRYATIGLRLVRSLPVDPADCGSLGVS